MCSSTAKGDASSVCVWPAEMEDVNTVRNTVKSLLYSDPSHLCGSGKKNYLTVVSKYFHKNV